LGRILFVFSVSNNPKEPFQDRKTSKAARVSLSGVEIRMGQGLNVQRYGEDVVNAGLEPIYPFKINDDGLQIFRQRAVRPEWLVV